MKKIVIVGVVVLGAVVVAVAVYRRNATTYHPKDVKIVAEGVSDHGAFLWFRPPSEAEYHCPGVKYSVKGGVITFAYVRARVDAEASVDSRAERQIDGSLEVTFPFPGGKWEKGDTVELVDSSGKRFGRWKHAGQTEKTTQ